MLTSTQQHLLWVTVGINNMEALLIIVAFVVIRSIKIRHEEKQRSADIGRAIKLLTDNEFRKYDGR